MNQVFKRLIFASIQMELKKMHRVFITKTQEVFSDGICMSECYIDATL